MCHIILVIKVGWKCMINMIYNTFFAKYCIYPPFWYLPLKLFDQSKPWGKICSNLATTATTKFLLRNHLLPHAECTQPHFFYIHTIILTISLNAEEAFFKRCCYMEATDFCNTPKWNYNLSQWKFVYKSWAVSHNFFFLYEWYRQFYTLRVSCVRFYKAKCVYNSKRHKMGV